MNPMIIIKDIGTFFSMTKAILRGQYKMPWNTLLWAIVCLVYFISPIDILPDFFPLLGIADDGAFILYVLTLLHKDLNNFRQSQHKQDTVIEAEVVRTFSRKDEDKK